MLLLVILMILLWAGMCELSGPTYGFNGDRLTFVLFHNPPYSTVIFRPDGNYSYTGTGPLWQTWMTKKLNFTIKYMMLNQSTIQQSGMSDFDLAIHLVSSKKVDVYSNGVVATPERKQIVDLTYFIWTEPYSMVVPQPEEESRIFAFIYPYQPTVWLLIVIAMIAMVLFMTLISVLYVKITDNGTPVLSEHRKTAFEYANDYTMHIFSLITNQGAYIAVTRFMSLRVLMGVWVLMATVLVNVYSSTVISYLTVPRTKPPINTFEDLAASPDVGILLRTEALITQYVLTAKTGALKTIGDHARRHPDSLWTDQEKLSRRLATGHYAYPWVQTFCEFFIVNQFKKDSACRFRMTDPLPFQSAFFSIALQKNSKYTPAFNKALMELWESGLFPYWMRNALPRAPKCFARTKPRTISTQKMPIRLDDLLGVFFIFGIGLGLAILSIFIEKIVSCGIRRMAAAGEC
ncbi:glutamate receptor ionotropic, delta-1-like [Daphnia carinata]|uniref:glutamate receptor ionotropic, delta-1-like n=1 Tax=Daphnia carinata TaxID=120202 RepID=UPI00257C7B60|nr:glutamate receptor ionotropic, delta-1-like [Daphnia carinata]XP_059350920.1 glutamate receptor ionotropic, delta-1-like [Daphnia carinata]